LGLKPVWVRVRVRVRARVQTDWPMGPSKIDTTVGLGGGTD